MCWNDTTNSHVGIERKERAKRLSSKRMGRIREGCALQKAAVTYDVLYLLLCFSLSSGSIGIWWRTGSAFLYGVGWPVVCSYCRCCWMLVCG